jgi:hypothetical protein
VDPSDLLEIMICCELLQILDFSALPTQTARGEEERTATKFAQRQTPAGLYVRMCVFMYPVPATVLNVILYDTRDILAPVAVLNKKPMKR